MSMYAITIHQPYATLIAAGHKKIETRSWAAPDWLVGERIAIHAGKSKEDLHLCERLGELAGVDLDPEGLPFGAVVATAVLERCAVMRATPIEQLERLDPVEFACGNFAVGRYAWLLADVGALHAPVPARGYQKVWTWDA